MENPIIRDVPFADEPKVIDICVGCSYDIYDYEEQIEVLGDVILHDDDQCIANYIRSEWT